MNRTTLYATAGSALALALLAYSPPVSAEVDVFASIQKTKDITITEHITITKIVNLTVRATELDYDAAAEADAIVNQENTNNDVDSSFDQLGDIDLSQVNNFGIDLKATITGSINNNTGIVDVNQDVGNMTNQANQVALAVATPASATPSPTNFVVVNSQSEAEQINQNNRVRHLEDPGATPEVSLVDPPNESASITDSINGNTGIVNVNQNAGNMNNQANSEALAVAIDLAGVALSEAALGQVNGGVNADEGNGANTVFEAGVTKSASLAGSLNGNTGIGGVNQAAGNMANQANIFSLAFIDGGGGVGLGAP